MSATELILYLYIWYLIKIVAVNDMGKINSRIISFVMVLVITGSLCFGLTGCKKSVPRADIKELQSRDGLMLVISGSIEGPIDYYDEDRLTGSKYYVFWNGKIQRTGVYLSSGEDEAGSAVLSASDYLLLYNFCEDAYINDTYKGYQENDIMDGTTYSFMYYPADRDSGVCLYGGYCVNNKTLSNVVSTVSSYFKYSVRATPTPVPSVSDLQARSGYMLRVSTSDSGDIRPGADGYCMVSYYIEWDGEIVNGRFSGEVHYSVNEPDADVSIWFNGQPAVSETKTLAAAGNYFVIATDRYGNSRTWEFIVERRGEIPWNAVYIAAAIAAVIALLLIGSDKPC